MAQGEKDSADPDKRQDNDTGTAATTASKSAARRSRPVKRKGWTTVYATEEERIVIGAQAEAAGLSLAQFLVARALREQVVVRADWRAAVARLSEVSARLGDLSTALEDRTKPLDAVRLHLDLCRIEAAARGLLTPAQRQIARSMQAIDFEALRREWDEEAEDEVDISSGSASEP
jgi:hypothetical protein